MSDINERGTSMNGSPIDSVGPIDSNASTGESTDGSPNDSLGTSTRPVSVLIADDQDLVRDGFRMILSSYEGVSVIGEARDGLQAYELARMDAPDVVLMDIRMPHVDGIAATKKIASDPACAHTHVLVLTTFDIDEYVYDALAAGASGFMLKDAEPDDIVRAIRVVSRGDALIQPSITRRLIEHFVREGAQRQDGAGEVQSNGSEAHRTSGAGLPDAIPMAPTSHSQTAQRVRDLTDREREILVLVARGMDNAQIADDLVISPATVKTHLARIMAKLDAHDRAQLVVDAYECGLVVPGCADAGQRGRSILS